MGLPLPHATGGLNSGGAALGATTGAVYVNNSLAGAPPCLPVRRVGLVASLGVSGRSAPRPGRGHARRMHAPCDVIGARGEGFAAITVNSSAMVINMIDQACTFGTPPPPRVRAIMGVVDHGGFCRLANDPCPSLRCCSQNGMLLYTDVMTTRVLAGATAMPPAPPTSASANATPTPAPPSIAGSASNSAAPQRAPVVLTAAAIIVSVCGRWKLLHEHV